jgi:major membrane immunogen (membrane-anchored lipoprotein)
MKQNVIYILLLFVLTNCSLKEEKCKTYYDSGELKTEYDCSKKSNELIGDYAEYYKNGTLKIKGTYATGKLNGDYIKFDENGDTLFLHKFEQGKQKDCFAYKENYRKTFFPYMNGQIHGKVLGFNKGGGLIEEVTYSKGKINGISILYDEDGRLFSFSCYDSTETLWYKALFRGDSLVKEEGYPFRFLMLPSDSLCFLDAYETKVQVLNNSPAFNKLTLNVKYISDGKVLLDSLYNGNEILYSFKQENKKVGQDTIVFEMKFDRSKILQKKGLELRSGLDIKYPTIIYNCN